jgi:hypothetical protein
MLNDTITLNVGNPAADLVFERAYRQGNMSVFYAPSPNDDLAGRYVLTVSQEETSQGIARSMVSIKKPLQNADGEYDAFIKKTMTCTRPLDAALSDVDLVLECAQEIWADTGFREGIGKGES